MLLANADFLVALLAAPQVLKAWKFRADDPSHGGYYVASAETRLGYAIAYIGLLVIVYTWRRLSGGQVAPLTP